MIFDDYKNAYLYRTINSFFEEAFNFINTNDLNRINTGDYEINKDLIFAKVRQYETKSEKKSSWESHKNHIDIQYLVSGKEYLGYSNINNMKQNHYQKDKDNLILSGMGDFLMMEKNSFAILFPQDAHMPGVLIDKKEIVKKVIIKIKI
jgi:YhcH/YjgK/YiaL family protein